VTGPTRWGSLPPAVRGRYADKFTRLVVDGSDIDGEARLADALAPRGARILDAGAGMGRVGAALQAGGHDVTAVEVDPELVALCRRTYPGLPVIDADLTTLSPLLLAAHDRPTAYDLVVAVGNVMVYLAEATEASVLHAISRVLAPQGRVLLGFDLTGSRPGSRVYPVDALVADAAAAGLVVEVHAGTYDLRPPTAEFAVLVLGRQREQPAAGREDRPAG